MPAYCGSKIKHWKIYEPKHNVLCSDIFVSGLNYNKALVFGGKHKKILACGSEIINVYLLKPALYHTLQSPSITDLSASSCFELKFCDLPHAHVLPCRSQYDDQFQASSLGTLARSGQHDELSAVRLPTRRVLLPSLPLSRLRAGLLHARWNGTPTDRQRAVPKSNQRSFL